MPDESGTPGMGNSQSEVCSQCGRNKLFKKGKQIWCDICNQFVSLDDPCCHSDPVATKPENP